MCAIKSSSVSTGSLNALLRVHVRPIYLVVSQGTLELNSTKSHLGEGLALICFQRLSCRRLVTQPRRWHDDWNARAAYL